MIPNLLRPAYEEAIFGEIFPRSDRRHEVLLVCQKHYRKLRNMDGIVLGYRKYNGKVRAYIKHESF